MPTITYRRTWCKQCNDYTLHLVPLLKSDAPEACKVCGTEFTEILLSEIPADKIAFQRGRYKEAKKRRTEKFLSSSLIFGGGIENMFSSSAQQSEVIEDDAGQAEIDNREKQEREEAYRIRQEEKRKLTEEAKKYAHLGRNDLCACNSGKKYKKCCMDKFSTI